MCYRSHSDNLRYVVMTLILEKDFLAGALLSEVVRQHPNIRLSSVFVDEILGEVEYICMLFAQEATPVVNSSGISRHSLNKVPESAGRF